MRWSSWLRALPTAGALGSRARRLAVAVAVVVLLVSGALSALGAPPPLATTQADRRGKGAARDPSRGAAALRARLLAREVPPLGLDRWWLRHPRRHPEARCDTDRGRRALRDPGRPLARALRRAGKERPALARHRPRVPLANAWRSGAKRWTTDKRETYANDPKVLMAVDAGLNRQKGDDGHSNGPPVSGLPRAFSDRPRRSPATPEPLRSPWAVPRDAPPQRPGTPDRRWSARGTPAWSA
jgi:hypothetical protein